MHHSKTYLAPTNGSMQHSWTWLAPTNKSTHHSSGNSRWMWWCQTRLTPLTRHCACKWSNAIIYHECKIYIKLCLAEIRIVGISHHIWAWRVAGTNDDSEEKSCYYHSVSYICPLFCNLSASRKRRVGLICGIWMNFYLANTPPLSGPHPDVDIGTL